MTPAAARLAGAPVETSREEGAADLAVANERCIPPSAPSVVLTPRCLSYRAATGPCTVATALAP